MLCEFHLNCSPTYYVWLWLMSFFFAVICSLIPEKLIREWKELLFRGLPLYEPVNGQQPGCEFSSPLNPVELKKQEILNNQDYDEYTVSLKHECSRFSSDILYM